MSSLPGLTANFDEPTSNDSTSAPPEQIPSQSSSSPVSQALGTAKRKKGFGPGIKNPGALAGAIARARKARPNALKYGN